MYLRGPSEQSSTHYGNIFPILLNSGCVQALWSRPCPSGYRREPLCLSPWDPWMWTRTAIGAKTSHQRMTGWKGAVAGCPCPQGPPQLAGDISALQLFGGCRVSVHCPVSVSRQRNGSATEVLRTLVMFSEENLEVKAHFQVSDVMIQVSSHMSQFFLSLLATLISWYQHLWAWCHKEQECKPQGLPSWEY